MFTYSHKLRVRYGDTDQMGYVYYGNYAYYYEQARAEAMRSIDLSYKEIEDSGVMMPVTRMNVKYIQPAFYDQELVIKAIVPSLPNRIMVFKYEVLNPDGVLINEGETHLIFIDAVSKKIKNAPPVLLEKFKPYFKF